MKVLVVDEGTPLPLNTGKRIRTWNLLKRMADRHEITFLCWGSAEAPTEHYGVRFVTIGRNLPAMQGSAFYVSLLKNIFSPLPYSVQRHASKEIKEAYSTILDKEEFDLIHCEWTPYVEVARSSAGDLPLVLSAHNVESRIWERYFLNEQNWAKKKYIFLQYKKFERFEQRAAQLCSHVVTVSEEDSQEFSSYGCKNVSVVPNGVEDSYFFPVNTEQRPHSMVFTGSMDWRPNQDGITFFLQDIFPLIRRQLPEAEVSVVGRNPPGWLLDKASNMPGVKLTGTVDDVRPYIAQAGLYIVPLRVGGGSRLKILEALAMKKVVLSTHVGAEGLNLQNGVHILLQDDPQSFADAAVQTLESIEAYLPLADAGHRQVLKHYTWDKIAPRLDEVWCSQA